MKRSIRTSDLIIFSAAVLLAFWAYYMLAVVGVSKNAVFFKLAACALLCLISALTTRMVVRFRMAKVSDMLEEHDYPAAVAELDYLIKNETIEPEALLGRCFIAALFEDSAAIATLCDEQQSRFSSHDIELLQKLSRVVNKLRGKSDAESVLLLDSRIISADEKPAAPFYSDMLSELSTIEQAFELLDRQKITELRSLLSHHKRIEFNQVYNDVMTVLWDYLECSLLSLSGERKKAAKKAEEALLLCRATKLGERFEEWRQL